MSLINCPKCSKEVSDKIEFCPHCGYQFANEKDSNEQQADTMEIAVNKKSKKNRVILFSAILLIIALVGGIIFYIQTIQLNEYENYALNIINNLKDKTDDTEKLVINSIDFLAPIEIKHSQPEVEKFIKEFVDVYSISEEHPACVISLEIQKTNDEPTSGYLLSVYNEENKEYINFGMCLTLDESIYQSLYELGIISLESLKEQSSTALAINCLNNDKNKVGNIDLSRIRKAMEK